MGTELRCPRAAESFLVTLIEGVDLLKTLAR